MKITITKFKEENATRKSFAGKRNTFLNIQSVVDIGPLQEKEIYNSSVVISSYSSEEEIDARAHHLMISHLSSILKKHPIKLLESITIN